MDWLIQGDFASAPTDFAGLVLALLLAFLSGQAISWVYMWTHSGLSYSRSFVNSLVVMPIIVALVMMVLANSLVTAFGMMAVFAIVRFRNILRDTLDTTYVLCVIVVGMACGTMKYGTAILGCILICGMLLYLWYVSYGTRLRYDVILNLHWSRPMEEIVALKNLLNRHSLTLNCVSQRSSESFEGTDLSYRILLRDNERMDDLLMELRGMPGVSRVTGLKAEEESEI